MIDRSGFDELFEPLPCGIEKLEGGERIEKKSDSVNFSERRENVIQLS
jgi:hypothetical protein